MYWKCEKLRLLVIPQENESYEHFGVAHLPKHPPRADKSAMGTINRPLQLFHTPRPQQGLDKPELFHTPGPQRGLDNPRAISYTKTSAGA